MTSRVRGFALRAVLIACGLLAGLAGAEFWVRAYKLTPQRQIIAGHNLHTVDGVPVWEEVTARQNRGCVEQHPERTRILFFGSSITYGFEVDEVFTTLLEARLNELHPTPGFCVLNFAQSGFQFEQKYAVARTEVRRYKPALIMWEDWTEWHAYRIIGDTAYGTDGLAIRPDGFIGLACVPDGLNRMLFLHSRLYEYLALAFGERTYEAPGPGGAMPFYNMSLIQVLSLAQSVGAKLVFYLATPLDRPFADTAASPPDWQVDLLQFARVHGIPAYALERELIDQDYLQLRLDPCCHFNAAGHRALMPIMERIVLEQLDRSPEP